VVVWLNHGTGFATGWGNTGGVTMLVVIDWIDQLIMAREAEELALLHRKAELVKEAIEAHPNATRAEHLSMAYALDEEFPTPLLDAIQLNMN
jgi:hypothetical protein